jgi:hypothetical protein
MKHSYLWTYDLYGHVRNAFDAGKSITRASGRGLSPGNRDFFGRCRWHRADTHYAQGLMNHRCINSYKWTDQWDGFFLHKEVPNTISENFSLLALNSRRYSKSKLDSPLSTIREEKTDSAYRWHRESPNPRILQKNQGKIIAWKKSMISCLCLQTIWNHSRWNFINYKNRYCLIITLFNNVEWLESGGKSNEKPDLIRIHIKM